MLKKVNATNNKILFYKKNISEEFMISVCSVLVFFLCWHIIAIFEIIALPTPIYTVIVFLKLIIFGDPFYKKTLQQFVFLSLQVVLLGVLASFIAGFILGILMGYFKKVEVFTNTIIEMLRPIPPLAWIPLGYIIFSFVDSPSSYVQVLVVFVGAFFPILVNTVQGVKATDKRIIDAARSCGAEEKDIFFKVIIPSALPHIITGLRIGLGVGWMCIVAAEFVGGRTGIGYYIWSVYSLGGRSAEIISGMATIGIVSFLLNKSILILEKRLTPWRYC